MAGDLTRLCCSSCPRSILPQWSMMPLTFSVSVSWRESTGRIFTMASKSLFLCPILLPLLELPWKILCACVGFAFHLLNCYKLKLWLSAFSTKAKWTGKSMLWYWPLKEEEVVSSICLLLCWGLQFCPTVSLTGHYASPIVCCCMAWDMPVIILSNIQYKLLGSILCFQSARNQPASPAVCCYKTHKSLKSYVDGFFFLFSVGGRGVSYFFSFLISCSSLAFSTRKRIFSIGMLGFLWPEKCFYMGRGNSVENM